MFGYLELLEELELLCKDYTVKVMGKSLFGREIFCLHNKGAKALVHGGIHAREHITAKLVVELAKKYKGENICFVPLVNPDGAELCVRGIDTVPISYRNFLLELNSHSQDFSLWKANGRAVDLNVNFDADWGMGQSNKRYPSSSDYIGEYAFSETESRALRDYTLNNDFWITVSYHAKGEIIYYGYGNNQRGRSFAKRLSDINNYKVEQSLNSAGGYKDWFCSITDRVGLTIEVGKDEYAHPFPYSEFGDIINKNATITDLIEKELVKLKHY